MKAFTLSAPDNDSYMLTNLPPSLRCGSCGRNVDPAWTDPTFAPTIGHWDVSYTYDGYFIVSSRFREVLADRGAGYVELPAQPSCFVLVPLERLEFDAMRRGTKFENFCTKCSRYHDVAGATPAFLRFAPPPNELRGTDIEFGSGDEQHPLLVVGSTLADELRAADLSGLDLHPIAD